MRKLFALLSLLLLVSCGQKVETADGSKSEIPEAIAVNADVSVKQLEAVLNSGRDIYLLDVRTPGEHTTAHLAGTDDLIPYDSINVYADRLPADKDADLFVYCRSGRRSGIAAKVLRDDGYTNVHNLEGGITAWQTAGLPTESGK